MRLLLWNVGLGPEPGPGPKALRWLTSRDDWDVAVLLEVNQAGWDRLDVPEQWERSGSIEVRRDHGRKYTVALLARPTVTLGQLVDAPAFSPKNGYYAERAHALRVKADEQSWTLLGIHMPNSRTGGTTDHQPKEQCFRELREWIEQRPDDERLVVAMDANHGTSRLSTQPPNPSTPETVTFLRHPERLGLTEALWDAHPDAMKPETHWGTSGNVDYFDRIFTNRHVDVEAWHSFGQTPDSDHAPILVDLRPN